MIVPPEGFSVGDVAVVPWHDGRFRVLRLVHDAAPVQGARREWIVIATRTTRVEAERVALDAVNQ